MNNTIQVKIRNVYGYDLAYPVNGQAQHIANIADTKTLTKETLTIAQNMGFIIEIVSNPTLADL
jgi:hypothetical protein